MKGHEVIISAVGPAGFGEQQAIIDAAIKAGVKRYIPSEWSVNTLSATVRDLVPIFQTKYEVLNHLATKEAEGFSWTGIAAGPLFDWVCRRGHPE